MDGKRIQEYWSQEVDSMLATYRQFETLVPSEDHAGSAHHGEDGRYVEDLIREYLSKFLPKELEVLTGFILRPAVKTGESGKERRKDNDQCSSQLDIIVYDSSQYPVFQRFGESVIVPPEGVVAIMSVKKNLNDGDIKKETSALWKASVLCRTQSSNKPEDKIRGPFLAIVSMHSIIEKKTTGTLDWIFEKIKQTYDTNPSPLFDDIVGYVGALDEWSMFKARPKKNKKSNALLLGFLHKDKEAHLGLQYILTGILSVYYDETRKNVRRPGFTAFESGRNVDKPLGEVACSGLR